MLSWLQNQCRCIQHLRNRHEFITTTASHVAIVKPLIMRINTASSRTTYSGWMLIWYGWWIVCQLKCYSKAMSQRNANHWSDSSDSSSNTETTADERRRLVAQIQNQMLSYLEQTAVSASPLSFYIMSIIVVKDSTVATTKGMTNRNWR